MSVRCLVKAVWALGVASISMACDEGQPTAAASQSTAAVSDAGKALYMARCSACHGATGAGDGLAAASLDPKPRDLSDPAWQSSVTDEHISQIIAQGGSAVGKSAAMPPAPDLARDAAKLNALVVHVRSFKR